MKKQCKSHGSYTAEKIELAGVTIYSQCPDCGKEQEQERERQQSELKAKQLEAIKRKAGLCKRYQNASFNDYTVSSSDEKVAFDAVKSLAENIACNRQGASLIVSGGLGTGKTLLASAGVNYCLERNVSACIIKLSWLMREIKESYSRKDVNESDIIDSYSSKKMLVIDEIGVQHNTENEKIVIFDIVNGRYENMLPTVLISNLDIDGIKQVVGERAIDRLRDNGKLITMHGKSRRGAK